MSTEDTLSTTKDTLRDLLQTLEDGRKGFTDAAGKLADDGQQHLAASFRGFAEQRARFATELRTAASSAGIQLDEDGSVAGALHRGWMALKDALTGDSPEAVVNAASTGEDHAVSEFEDALEGGDLPPEVRTMVQDQAREIRRTRDEVAALGD